LRLRVLALAIGLATSHLAFAQWMGKQTGCYTVPMAANPNRPTVANPADITQYGVLELEYGWDRFWPEANSTLTSGGGLLKFGLLCDLELRWNTVSYISVTDPSGNTRGIGDNAVGPQLRFYHQTKHVPSLAVSYSVKIPSADSAKGLGSGKVDHAFLFLASKDIAGFHLDFNVAEFLDGRTSGSGFDKNQLLTLSTAHPIRGPLALTAEFYGTTELNSSTPGFASTLWALSYAVTKRFVVDGGYEAGLTAGGPHRHAFFGATYSIANLYPGWRKQTSSKPNNP
jgi:hypothetical protein